MKRAAAVAIVAAPLVALAAWFMLRESDRAPSRATQDRANAPAESAVARSVPEPALPLGVPTSSSTSSTSAEAAAPISTGRGGVGVDASARIPLRLSAPRENLQTAMRLLEAGDDDAFRATFLPSVRGELTADAITSCRRRLVGKTLKPDWEVAESSVEPNEAGAPHRVVRVSIFGKSMTGFHEAAPDEWLADAAWCVPIF